MSAPASPPEPPEPAEAAEDQYEAALAAVGPPRGPCGLCGHDDARHRIADAWASRFVAGDTAAEIAADFEVPEVRVAVTVAHVLAAAVEASGLTLEEATP